MKKILLSAILIGFVLNNGFAQDQKIIDSLKNELANTRLENQQVSILINLCTLYWGINLDSSLKYAQKALSLAQQTGDLESEATVLLYIGGVYKNIGDYPKSFEFLLRGLEFARKHKYSIQTINSLGLIGEVYREIQDFPKAISYHRQALEISVKIRNHNWITQMELFMGIAYRNNNQLDSAFFYTQKAIEGEDTLKNVFLERTLFTEMGVIQFKLGDHVNAFQNVHKNILINKKDNDHRTLAIAFNYLADFFKTLGNVDSSIYYARQALYEAQTNRYNLEILKSGKLLAEVYEHKDLREALYYHKMSSAINEELFGVKKTNDLQKTLAEEQERQRQGEAKRIAYENQLRQYVFFAGLMILLFIALLLYRNNIRVKKS